MRQSPHVVKRIRRRPNCEWCGTALTSRKGARMRTVDHVVPRSRGGTDAPANTKAACYRCNQLRNAFHHCPGALACYLTTLCYKPRARPAA